MKPRIKAALGLAVLACVGGAALAATMVDMRQETKSASIWIGPALDSDRAVNAMPDAQAVIPVRSPDPAKAQMAASPANAEPVSILPSIAAGASIIADSAPVAVPAVDKSEPAKAAAPAGESVETKELPAISPPPSPTVSAQVTLPVPPRAIAAPVVPTPKSQPAQPAQMTRPPLDATPAQAAPAPPGVTAPVQPSANSLSGGAVFSTTSGRDLNIEINRGALIRLRAAADTVFVANPDIADIQVKSPRMIYVYGKKAGETVLYAVDGDDNVLLNSRVNVTHNLTAFRTALRTAAPDSGVDVSTSGDALVISGDVGSAVQAENVRRLAARFAPGDGSVVNQMRVTAPNQINLRVRVAEVSRETLKQFGINWDAAFSAGGFLFGLATGNPVLAGDFVVGSLSKTFNVRGNQTNSVVGGFNKGGFDVNGLIDALANENLITVLAEPNLTAISGETANFLAGGEFPIPVAQSNNNGGSITIEFKKFGVSLAFTPTVLEGGRVNLKVRPEVSQLSTVGQIQVNGLSIPALTTRRAETTVELASGQSFAIAGLLQNNSTQDANKVPFLGEVPILGALFKSDRYRRNETELVIVVTPYLVRPVSNNVVALPTDGFSAPTDGQRILYGSTNQQGMPEGARVTRGPDGNALIGPAGFQLD